jgi:hypothetical protein
MKGSADDPVGPRPPTCVGPTADCRRAALAAKATPRQRRSRNPTRASGGSPRRRGPMTRFRTVPAPSFIGARSSAWRPLEQTPPQDFVKASASVHQGTLKKIPPMTDDLSGLWTEGPRSRNSPRAELSPWVGRWCCRRTTSPSQRPVRSPVGFLSRASPCPSRSLRSATRPASSRSPTSRSRCTAAVERPDVPCLAHQRIHAPAREQRHRPRAPLGRTGDPGVGSADVHDRLRWQLLRGLRHRRRATVGPNGKGMKFKGGDPYDIGMMVTWTVPGVQTVTAEYRITGTIGGARRRRWSPAPTASHDRQRR